MSVVHTVDVTRSSLPHKIMSLAGRAQSGAKSPQSSHIPQQHTNSQGRPARSHEQSKPGLDSQRLVTSCTYLSTRDLTLSLRAGLASSQFLSIVPDEVFSQICAKEHMTHKAHNIAHKGKGPDSHARPATSQGSARRLTAWCTAVPQVQRQCTAREYSNPWYV